MAKQWSGVVGGTERVGREGKRTGESSSLEEEEWSKRGDRHTDRKMAAVQPGGEGGTGGEKGKKVSAKEWGDGDRRKGRPKRRGHRLQWSHALLTRGTPNALVWPCKEFYWESIKQGSKHNRGNGFK